MCDMNFLVFGLFVLLALAVDMWIHRQARAIQLKEALLSTLFWFVLALLFNLWIAHCRGAEDALTFLTAYLVEKSLSIDNLFVFLLIFNTFQIPEKHLHKILFLGVFGALFFRALFIVGGLALIEHFKWVLYLFGAFLIYTALRLTQKSETPFDLKQNRVPKLIARFFPLSEERDSGQLFINGALTPLFLALITIEMTDIIFAIDSIPAVFAITLDPFLVYTSNIFAILGLRSLFFTVRHLLTNFNLLHYGLAFILGFIGIKMLLEPWVTIPIQWTLATIATAITLSIAASALKKQG